jgi:sporulation protein YlmC with PRC-barrel domain
VTGLLLGSVTALALGMALTAGAQEQTQTEQPQAGATSEQPQAEQPQAEQPQAGATSEPEAPAAADSGEGEVAQEPIPLEGQIVTQEEGTFAVSDLIGQDATSPEGEPVGEVADLLLTSDSRVAGLVIKVGGILGFGGKNVAVDMSRVTIGSGPDDQQQVVMIDYTPEELEQAPELVTLADQERARQEEEARQQAQQSPTGGIGQPPPASSPAPTQ